MGIQFVSDNKIYGNGTIGLKYHLALTSLLGMEEARYLNLKKEVKVTKTKERKLIDDKIPDKKPELGIPRAKRTKGKKFISKFRPHTVSRIEKKIKPRRSKPEPKQIEETQIDWRPH